MMHTITQARKEVGISQRAFAERVGMNRLTIRRAEDGKPLMLDKTVRILKMLNTLRSERGLPELRLDDVEWLREK